MSQVKTPLDPLDKEAIWRLFRQAQNKTKAYIAEICKNHGISVQEAILLREISNQPGITANELGQKLNLAKSTLSSMIARLEENNMLIREVPRHNRRIVELRIAPAFSDKPEIAKIKSEFLEGLFSHCSAEDAAVILQGLTKLNEVLNEVNP